MDVVSYILAKKNGGGGSNSGGSWNTLKDKPFGVELECIFDEILDFTYNAQIGGYTSYLQESINVHANDEVVVGWDGEQYECTVMSPFPDVLIIGNASAMGMSDTGEPFLYAYSTNAYDKTEVLFYTFSSATPNTHDIKVYTRTVKTIDPKFLPETVATKDYVTEQLNKLINGNEVEY